MNGQTEALKELSWALHHRIKPEEPSRIMAHLEALIREACRMRRRLRKLEREQQDAANFAARGGAA
jgi:hypothetical protein